MFSVDFIRRVPGKMKPDFVTLTVAEAATAEAATEAGHRAFISRGAEAKADGFRVVRRDTMETVYTWLAPPPDR